jgi:hypothetical protein
MYVHLLNAIVAEIVTRHWTKLFSKTAVVILCAFETTGICFGDDIASEPPISCLWNRYYQQGSTRGRPRSCQPKTCTFDYVIYGRGLQQHPLMPQQYQVALESPIRAYIMRPIALLRWASCRCDIASLLNVYICNWFQTRGTPCLFNDLRPTLHKNCIQTRSSRTESAMYARRNCFWPLIFIHFHYIKIHRL